jgi:hypothetical protein
MHGAPAPKAIIKIAPFFNNHAYIPIQYNFPLTEPRPSEKKMLKGKSAVHRWLAWESQAEIQYLLSTGVQNRCSLDPIDHGESEPPKT